MESIQAVFTFIVEHWNELFEIVGAFAVISTMTPNKSDDRIVNWILTAINALGANIGRASNSDA